MEIRDGKPVAPVACPAAAKRAQEQPMPDTVLTDEEIQEAWPYSLEFKLYERLPGEQRDEARCKIAKQLKVAYWAVAKAQAAHTIQALIDSGWKSPEQVEAILWSWQEKAAVEVEAKVREELAEEAELVSAVKEFLDIVSDSEGIAGWHLNGAILEWEQCEQIQKMSDVLADLERRAGMKHE